MRHRVISISLASVFVAAGVGLAQVGEPAASQPGDDFSIVPRIITTSTAPATTTGPGGAATMDSAESVLQNLLRDKGTVGAGGVGAGGAGNPSIIATTGPALGADGLLREGQQLQVRSGHLKKDETGSSVFVFDDRQQPHYPPMGVIPSRRLERMEDVAFADGHSGADTTFVVDAEVTQYRGKNFLYIGRTPFGMPKRPATASGPATAATASAPASMTSIVDIPAPDTPVAVLLAETTVIAGRDGRFVKDLKTGTELLTFFADGKKMFDPPMGLIPCKMLAYMEDQTEMGNKPVRFRVSGEVTLYRGKNYLYLRTAWEVPDLNQGIGNFDPKLGHMPVAPKAVRPGG